jgi:hypothetical protein
MRASRRLVPPVAALLAAAVLLAPFAEAQAHARHAAQPTCAVCQLAHTPPVVEPPVLERPRLVVAGAPAGPTGNAPSGARTRPRGRAPPSVASSAG